MANTPRTRAVEAALAARYELEAILDAAMKELNPLALPGADIRVLSEALAPKYGIDAGLIFDRFFNQF